MARAPNHRLAALSLTTAILDGEAAHNRGQET
jgi:hypothetical protein